MVCWRLLKALRHDAPGIADTVKRLKVKPTGEAVACVLKTQHTAHGGKMSITRVLTGQSATARPSSRRKRSRPRRGVFRLVGHNTEKRSTAAAGETVALGKLEHAKTGDTLTAGKQAHPALPAVTPHGAVLAIAISAKERKDDVKLGQRSTS